MGDTTDRFSRPLRQSRSGELVTGANRGIGRQYVLELLDRGAAKVYATARRPDTLRRRQRPGHKRSEPCDRTRTTVRPHGAVVRPRPHER